LRRVSVDVALFVFLAVAILSTPSQQQCGEEKFFLSRVLSAIPLSFVTSVGLYKLTRSTPIDSIPWTTWKQLIRMRDRSRPICSELQRLTVLAWRRINVTRKADCQTDRRIQVFLQYR